MDMQTLCSKRIKHVCAVLQCIVLNSGAYFHFEIMGDLCPNDLIHVQLDAQVIMHTTCGQSTSSVVRSIPIYSMIHCVVVTYIVILRLHRRQTYITAV